MNYRHAFLALICATISYSPASAMDDLMKSQYIAASGMRAQSDRLRIVSQNIANVDSTGTTPGATPYRRKTIIFGNKMDPRLGTEKVVVRKYGADNKKEFLRKYEPSHPAADAEGYVLYPNVDKMIENVDAREAQRTYQANLSTIEIAKNMMFRTIDILR